MEEQQHSLSEAEIEEKEASLAKIVTAMRANKPQDAENLCRDYLVDRPGSIDHLRMLGHALLRQNRFQDAEENSRFAISLQPRFAPLHEDLGGILAAQGRLDEATCSLEQAVRLDPSRPTAHRKLGHVLAAAGRGREADDAFENFLEKDPARARVAEGLELYRAGRLVKAVETLRNALRAYPDNVDAMRFLAMAYRKQGKNLGDAEALLRRAVQIAPDYTAASLNLGTLLVANNKYMDAIDVYQAAIAQDNTVAEAWAGLGSACALAGYTDRAAEAYAKSVQLAPDMAGSHMSLAHALKTLGDQEQALKAYRRAIELRPDFGEAYWSIADLKIFRFEDHEVAAMEEQLNDADLSEVSEVHFRFALGKAYEDKKDYDTAWYYYDSGNKKQRMRVEHDPLVRHIQNEKILEVFDNELMRRNDGHGYGARDPIFIVSLPSSGSTLIEQVLASHSMVEGTAELSDLSRIANSVGRFRSDGIRFPESVRDLTVRDWKAFGKEYIESTRRHRVTDKPFFTDKMPNNFPLVGFAYLALPNAKFINARRHPLDSCLSSYKQLSGKGLNFTYDIFELGEYYEQYDALIQHWHEVMPGRVLDVHYEETVTDLEGQVRRILEHCGLPFEERCLRFYETERAVETASSEQGRQPICTGRLGKWRKYEAHLGEWKEKLEPIIERLPEVVRNAGVQA